MLLKITEKCDMNCIHCFENSNSNGKHMEMDVFYKTCEYIKNTFAPQILLISGGEPTLNPNFKDISKYAMEHFRLMCVLSNGMFDDDICEFLVKNNIQVQITNDIRYYPERIVKRNYSNFHYIDYIQTIVPMGRAKDNGIIATRNSPMCFNFRSITLQYNLKETIGILESMQKLCSPSVDINGNILCGELSSCYKIGNSILNTSENEILNNIRNVKCNKCGLFNNLSNLHKTQVGE